MVPGGKLGDDAAIAVVHLRLAVQLVRQEAALLVEHGHSRLVAGGFEGKYPHGCPRPALFAPGSPFWP